ncbi:hypothetical protein [Haloarchaeobius sp. HRN-SO-5]|uniref:hypothetical protein n=1 Tax=Haloarchaeobius sp. HRN-SO-5 TaxID=3446118 RepID=UPI003EBC791B
MFEDGDERRVDLAGAGAADVVAVAVRVRVVVALDERTAVEAVVVFGDRDGVAVDVVVGDTSFPAGVFVSTGVRVVAVAPGRERFLVDVAHPLSALEKFRGPQTLGG